MKRFHFPLDRVLAFRRLTAEAEQAKLEQCAAHVRAIDERIAALSRHEAGERDSVRGMESPEQPGVSTVSLNVYPAYRGAVNRMRAELDRQRAQAVHQFELQRNNSIAANQARELLERAKEMAQQRWTEEFNREIENNAAELFLARWKRGVKR